MDHPESDPTFSRSICLPPELLIDVFSQILLDPDSWGRRHVAARLSSVDSQVPGKEALRDVSLTCRSFQDLALPVRFRQVELYAEGMAESKANQPFTRLAASERLRSFVKVISLTVYKSLPESAEAILCGMHNLEEIQVDAPFEMTQPLYNHICSLHSLRRLEIAIHRRSFADKVATIAFKSEQTKLQSLVITYGSPITRMGGTSCLPRGPWDMPPPWLTSLALSPSIRHLNLPIPGIPLPFIGFTPRPVVTPLSHLSTLEVTAPVTMPEREEFWHLIKQAPSITTLILDGEVGRKDKITPDPLLPSEYLPALQHFQGHLRFAKLIVPGRPVSTIVLDSPPRNERLDRLRPLTLSTATIRSLYIIDQASLELVGVIATLFPELEELGMSLSGSIDAKVTQAWLQQDFSLDIRRLKQLRTLHIGLWHKTPVDQQETAISRLPNDHPLELVNFGSASLWKKRLGSWMKPETKH